MTLALGNRPSSAVVPGSSMTQITRAGRNDRNGRAAAGSGGPCGFVRGLRARTAERRVRVVDAAVDDGDADALAGRAERVRGGGADVRHGFEQILRVVGRRRRCA